MNLSSLAFIAVACTLAFSTGAAAQSRSKAEHKPAADAAGAAAPLHGSAKENVVDNATAAQAQAAVAAAPSRRTAPIKLEADKDMRVAPPKRKTAAVTKVKAAARYKLD
jgi:hypothetical protein